MATHYTPEVTDEVRRELARAIHRLPYGGGMGLLPVRTDGEPPPFGELIDALNKYADLMESIGARNTRIEQDLNRLRHDLAAVRRVLGTDRTPTGE